MIYTSTGAVTLEQVLQAADEALAPPEPEQPQAVEPAPAPAKEPAAKPSPPAEKMAKAAKLITTDRPLARRATAALRKAIAPILQRAGDEAAADVASKLRALEKADDSGDFATRIAAAADLTALDDIADAIFDDLLAVTADAGELALAAVGSNAEQDMLDRVNERAVAYAKKRGADLVSLQGDKNIVELTRAELRETIAAGLADNIGSAKIADAIQALNAFSPARAELIAGAEVRMANASGKTEAWDDARETQGIELQKGWQTSNDGDCCDDCSDNEAAGLIAFDDAFPSGADDEGDSHPNCHCVTYVEVVEPGSE
jgi:hypothetical protein